MRAGWKLVAMALVGVLFLGCTGGVSTPMATDGPNQVVLRVPNMT